MTQPIYRAVVKLERLTSREPDERGYARSPDVEPLSEVTLTGGTEENVLRQAEKHVGILVGTYGLVKSTEGGYQ